MRTVLILVSVVLTACGQGDARQQEKKAEAPAVAVSAIEVAPREVPVSFEAVARTEGSREVQVRARVAGIVERQLYNEGDAVKEGALLFRIERAPFEIELQQARGLLAQETARRDLARQELERLKGLADRRAISQKELDQAGSNAQQSAASVEIARARVRQAELNLSYTTVKAPIGGITGRALQSVGSLVAPNAESALLTTITRADPIWVRFAISEAEYARIRSAQDIEVKVENYPHAGKLNFAGSSVDPATGTVQMRAELPNPDHALLPGQYARVHVQAGTQQAFVVPQTAVAQNESGRFVWVAADGKAQPRPIRAGSWIGADWVVHEGLKPGDKVIVDNLVRLRPGVAVVLK
jgi:membrane fusion protein (multidrug efflux system)